MQKVLIFLSHYLPGYKSGGPLQTIKNIVDVLGDEVEFSIVTLDRDMDNEESYNDIEPCVWHKVGKSNVLYMPPELFTFFRIRKLMVEYDYDAVYLNSFFSFRFSILPILVYNFAKPRARLILAPRGEFSPGALALKAFKKKAYIKVARLLGFFKFLIFHASTDIEKEDIRTTIGAGVPVVVAKDLPNLMIPSLNELHVSASNAEVLKVCFISRIVPKKNLDYAIQVLMDCDDSIEFEVFGLKEDPDYWNRCLSLLKKLPPNISWSYGGELYPEDVKLTFAKFDVFLFPTRGENYGHVIAEALLSGTYPIISDQTPWIELEQRDVGKTIPLAKRNSFVNEIHRWCSMTPGERHRRKLEIQGQAISLVVDERDVQANRALFMDINS
jgi:glycosyltransferase involved in cell wall biosynthesis